MVMQIKLIVVVVVVVYSMLSYKGQAQQHSSLKHNGIDRKGGGVG